MWITSQKQPERRIRANVTYVIVNYEGSHLPGLVLNVHRAYYEISCMQMYGPKQWKFPDRPDICDYYDEDIVEIINPPKMLNSRGQVMAVPEVEKYWGGM